MILHLWDQSTYQISASYLQCMMHEARCLMHDTWCMKHDAWCSTLVDLIFVRTVSIPNLSLLPCFEAALTFFLTYRNITDLRTKPYIEAACCLKIKGKMFELKKVWLFWQFELSSAQTFFLFPRPCCALVFHSLHFLNVFNWGLLDNRAGTLLCIAGFYQL